MKRFLAVLLCLLAVPVGAEETLNEPKRWSLRLSLPEGAGPFPLVIFMPGCDGWEPFVERSADKHSVALEGWVFARIDVLSPKLIGTVCADNTGLARMREDTVEDASAAAKILAADPRIDPSRIVFMGQSMGGSAALDIASPHRRKLAKADKLFAAVISYYPWCYDSYGIGLAADFDTPVLILGGAEDGWTPVQRCIDLELKNPDKPFHIEVYPNSYHSFDLDDLGRYEMQSVFGTEIVWGNPETAVASRLFYLEWLEQIVVP